jgi:hypothetical protein
MRTKIFTTVIFMLVFISAQAQDDYRVLYYDGPSHLVDQSRAIQLDASNNIYITGNSYGTNKEDYLTIKYNAYGQQLWTARLDGVGHDLDIAYALKVDAAGNVFVTGTSRDNNQVNSEDIVTIKYSPTGTALWSVRYDAPQDCNYTLDAAFSIDVDVAGNPYVTGSSRTNVTSDDILTIKYNGSTGAMVWFARYNGPSGKQDVGKLLKLDRNGNVIIAGSSFKDGSDYDYVVIKYNSSGVQQWVYRYNGPGNGVDTLFDMAVDAGGNVYVTGGSKGSSSNLDYATVKIDGTNGSPVWISRYNGSANGIDIARALAVDGSGNLYVTGSSATSTGLDYITIKYSYDGSQVWAQKYNGPANGNDIASAISMRKLPCLGYAPCTKYEIYVTGQSAGVGTGNDYATVKYDQDGVEQWAKRFNRSGSSEDIPSAMALIDRTEFIFITGTSINDYATLWYLPTSVNTAENNGIPETYSLSQNYPNPFNPSTSISFGLPAASDVKLTVYNALGEKAETLVDEYMEAGTHSVNWNASAFNSGVYFYTITAGAFTSSGKMILVK